MLTVARSLQTLKSAVETAQRSILMLGGRTEGGANFNVVPEYCSFTVDRRINPDEDFDKEKRRLLDVLEKERAAGIDLDVEVLQEGRSCRVAEDGPVARALALAVEEITGRTPKFEMCPGLLEIRFYAEQGIPAFAYGPGLLTVSHGPNEFVPVKNIVECAQVYALTGRTLLAADER
jgi:succinyl-diaminopimelate desuccinylase